jgi:hypothetical protein
LDATREHMCVRFWHTLGISYSSRRAGDLGGNLETAIAYLEMPIAVFMHTAV